MSGKQIYRINGDAARTLEEFAAHFSDRLGLGYDWGGNLDAFNDILRGGFGTPEEGFVLVWENSALARQYLGHSETARRLERLLETCHQSWIADIQRRLDLAISGRGETLFETLVEIIESHPDIELRLE